MEAILRNFYENGLSYFVIFLLMAAGVFFWLYLGKTPFRRTNQRKKGELRASLGALSVALAGTLGVGNIAGVSLAIATAGPGALFWMWASALLAMILKYVEVVLAFRFKGARGYGAMDYMKKGIGGKLGRIAASVFALLCLFASLSMGGVLQADTAVACLHAAFGGERTVYSVLLALLCAVCLFGGVKAVTSASVRLVPLMSVLYIAMCLGVLFVCRDRLPSALSAVLDEAMQPLSAGGGILGFLTSVSVRAGVSRGMLSNEAGCGTAPMAHVTAEGGDGMRQGRMGMFEVFFDTVVLCSLTALVILVTGVCDTAETTGSGMLLPLRAFSLVYGKSADYLLAVAVLCFSFATVICWGYYGECCLAYFTRARWATVLYRTTFSASVLLGAVLASSFIWTLTDVILGLMTVMNVLALLVLAPCLRQSERCKLRGEEFLCVH